MSSVPVAGVDLPVADEMKVLGVVLDRRLSLLVRPSRDIGGKGMQLQLPCPGHPTHPQPTGTYSGLQSDTVEAGLLQRSAQR